MRTVLQLVKEAFEVVLSILQIFGELGQILSLDSYHNLREQASPTVDIEIQPSGAATGALAPHLNHFVFVRSCCTYEIFVAPPDAITIAVSTGPPSACTAESLACSFHERNVIMELSICRDT